MLAAASLEIGTSGTHGINRSVVVGLESHEAVGPIRFLLPTAIGYRTGFGTRKTFFRLFHDMTGMTPHDFRLSKSALSSPWSTLSSRR
jgi:hypothetical protein